MESRNCLESRWSKNCRSEVRNVAIVGGTHGNELHGIYLVQEFNAEPVAAGLKERYPSLSIQALIANPAAVAAIGTGAGRRYSDVDLNRCFLMKDLADSSVSTCEGLRAKEIDALLGPKSSANPRCDFIFDLHSTTSNTGILICFHPQDTFAANLIEYLHKKYPGLNSCVWSNGELPLLPSVARSGITVEVGPIAHSTANSALYQTTKALLHTALEYLEMHNRSKINGDDHKSYLESILESFTTYERVASIGYPRDLRGNICALVHPSLQGAAELNGGATIRVGDPIFENITDGSPVIFTGIDDEMISRNFKVEKAAMAVVPNNLVARAVGCSDVEVYYPMFINEAAYNEKDIAFVLMRKFEKVATGNAP